MSDATMLFRHEVSKAQSYDSTLQSLTSRMCNMELQLLNKLCQFVSLKTPP